MLYTKFQNYVLREIEESGEIQFTFLIPDFKELELGIEARLPYTDYKENFIINDNNFIELRRQLKEVMKNKNLGLAKYLDNKTSRNWEDCHYIFDKGSMEKFLSKKENWIFFERNDNSLYFIVENYQ